MRKQLISLLVCPKCKGRLEYRANDNEMVCQIDRVAYPIRNGVPILLEMDARKLEPRDNK